MPQTLVHFAGQIPGRATASWDEENGWSLLLAGDAVAARVHKGLSVVPDPEDVAAWAVVLLTHPELTPSRENHPFRDHTVADPAFRGAASPVCAWHLTVARRRVRLRQAVTDRWPPG